MDTRRFSLSTVLLAGMMMLQAGCSSVYDTQPPLADSTFVAVLADLHVADAETFAAAQAVPNAPQPPGSASTVRDSVLHEHGIPAEQYEATLAYYVQHPDEFVSVYNNVLDRLNRLDLP